MSTQPVSEARRCAVETCTRFVQTRGWCDAHYKRWKRYRDVRPDVPLQNERSWWVIFWQKVEKTETCWLWAASLDRHGYGHVRAPHSKTFLAHRLAYENVVGPIPDGLHLDHLCRVRRCVNPDHLEPVTQAENNRRAREAKAARKAGRPTAASLLAGLHATTDADAAESLARGLEVAE